ncbi:hypothetical protein MKW92_019197 [Papaver armeniacum]|nr:hypothetical protein MKW92_019197 [Papaver armeniacum]
MSPSHLSRNSSLSSVTGIVCFYCRDILQQPNHKHEPDDSMHIFTGHTDEPDDSMHIFTGYTGELYKVACSPTDATLVATGGGDDKGFLWEKGVGDWAQELQVWDMPLGSLKCTLDGPGGEIEWVRWHPRLHEVLAGSEDGTVLLWSDDRDVYLNMFFGHASSVTCGKTICTGSDDASLRVWNPKTRESVHIVINGHPYHTEGLTCLVISSDSSRGITGLKDGSVHIVNLITGKVIDSLLSHPDSVECIGHSPSHHRFAATGGLDQKLIIWDLERSTARCSCGHEGRLDRHWLRFYQGFAMEFKRCRRLFLRWSNLFDHCRRSNYNSGSNSSSNLSKREPDQYNICEITTDQTADIYRCSRSKY